MQHPNDPTGGDGQATPDPAPRTVGSPLEIAASPTPGALGYPQHGHPQHGHPQHGHPQHGHPQHGHPQHGHPQHGHYNAPPQQPHPQQAPPQHPAGHRPYGSSPQQGFGPHAQQRYGHHAQPAKPNAVLPLLAGIASAAMGGLLFLYLGFKGGRAAMEIVYGMLLLSVSIGVLASVGGILLVRKQHMGVGVGSIGLGLLGILLAVGTIVLNAAHRQQQRKRYYRHSMTVIARARCEWRPRLLCRPRELAALAG